MSIGGLVGAGYDATNMMLEGIRRANSTEPKAMIAAMNTIADVPGVRAVYSFTPGRHNSVLEADLGIYEYVQQDGKLIRKLVG